LSVPVLYTALFALLVLGNGAIYFLMAHLDMAHGGFRTSPVRPAGVRFLRAWIFALFPNNHPAMTGAKVAALVFLIRVALLAIMALGAVHFQVRAHAG
jgi:hypothetical protein